MNLRMAFWRTRCRMDVKTAKISAKGKCLVDGEIRKILVAEYHDFVFCNKKSQLVLTDIVQIAQLDAVNLDTDIGCDIINLRVLEKVRKGGISILAMLDVFERFQRRISRLW